ncbi:cytohesin-1 isoform X1 [Strongylocentrotus purpuratus]|uniref:Cytohesin-1 n=1 Tax=Strongylocentrotus purpuratus TaxID=7668 RepID=A0A7M7NQB0_STRPU|nr:cytohesin-1 isoform X1 [Strongylocentrotus purpuratus]
MLENMTESPVVMSPGPVEVQYSAGLQDHQEYASIDAQLHPDLTENELKLLLDIRRAKQQLLKEIKELEEEIANVNADLESMDYDKGTDAKTRQMNTGRTRFNMDPKKGIAYLIEHNLLKETQEEVAQFLYKGEGLNKTAIGDYLGERKDFNIAVLESFVALHEFKDMILVQALRQFLWSFRLPGEAQKIDRMMECFAKRYCETNPGVFESTDTCYVLSFAIIMLNTSLHNPNVKDKPTLERFFHMNRGINEGGDLPEDLLKSLYESIKNEPFKIPEDDGNDLTHTFFNPDKEGWLMKQGGRYKNWKRRWFILTDNCLYYFEFTTDREPKGIIPLENLQVQEVEDNRKAQCFELVTTNKSVIKAAKTHGDGRVVEGRHTSYRMSATTDDERKEWIHALQASISRDPFYEMLEARKKKASHKAET